MDRYLELNNDNTVVNVIIWDGASEYAPEGITLLPCAEHPGVTFGWKKTANGWIEPPKQEPTE